MIKNNPACGTARRPHRYPKATMAWMVRHPDAPLPWSYFDIHGQEVHVTDLPLSHPVRH